MSTPASNARPLSTGSDHAKSPTEATEAEKVCSALPPNISSNSIPASFSHNAQSTLHVSRKTFSRNILKDLFQEHFQKHFSKTFSTNIFQKLFQKHFQQTFFKNSFKRPFSRTFLKTFSNKIFQKTFSKNNLQKHFHNDNIHFCRKTCHKLLQRFYKTKRVHYRFNPFLCGQIELTRQLILTLL